MADWKQRNREPGRAPWRYCAALVRLTLLACGAAVAGGCSKGVKLIEVTGHVMVDHQPLEQGIIHFQPTDGVGPSAEAVVKAGEYKIPTTVGHKKVSIQGFKKVGQVPIGGPGGPMTDKLEQILPPKISDPNGTELTCNVEGAAQGVDFNVQSAAPVQK
jgi:hypothetical protein